jgi:hypothetical protein
VLSLAELFDLLDRLRGEVVDTLDNPPPDQRNEFSFGRVSGMMSGIALVRQRVEEMVESNNQRNEAQQEED